ncbi:multidrug resistance-associated protein 3 [Actinidia rufa]|uniref:Multidrug resistance-associated protein 3 n=1 Tax=Actinidia rufa TaxID=165716 RepID=A0A7J0DKL4_9ERIC|nr:multidrug resistance-associated protein 3 [Actinidia rufa]
MSLMLVRTLYTLRPSGTFGALEDPRRLSDVTGRMASLHRIYTRNCNMHSVTGSTTIRNFDQEPRFRDSSMRLIDGYSRRPKFYTAGAMEWLCFRLDMLSSITFDFSLVFLISVLTGTIDPS